MNRPFLTLAAVVMLAAWAGAQGPPPMSAAEQLSRFRTDRVLLGNLVDDGLGLAAATTTLEKADATRRTARSLADAVGRAAGDKDAARVAELGGHFETVVRDALAPSLDEARRLIPDDSPEAAKLKDVRRRALDDLDAVRNAIPPRGKGTASVKTADTRGTLDELRERLK